MTEVKIQEIANKIVREVSMLPNLSEYEAMMLCATKALRSIKENEKQNINLANKALIERGVEWLKKGLDNGMWVDQFLNIKEKKAIIEHFKEWMEKKNKKKER